MSEDPKVCLYCLEPVGDQDPCPLCGEPREFQNPPGALSPGTKLAGRYIVGRALGQGGFGITYLAWEEQLTRPVAIKEFFPREISYRDNDRTTVQPMSQYTDKFSDILERFLLEARTVATFHHPNIVPIWFSFQENSTAYFVMPFRRGRTLEHWLYENQETVTEEALLDIFIPLLKGLEAVHQAGILHRDIKPRNIYIDEDDTPLLLDFGSARNVMSESFSVMMTHGYAPLEQYFSQQSSKQGRQGPWTDIYAVAATMYACFRCQFEGPQLVPIDRAPERVERDQLPHIRQVARCKLRSEVAEAVMRGLRVNPKERPQTTQEFRKMIEPELTDTTLPPPPDAPLELRCVAGEHEGLAVPLSAAPIVIGWDPKASALVCSESVISSRHCLVYAEHGIAYVKDLDSLNGTFVNDEERLRPERTVMLRAGDTINLAGVIVFQIAEADGAAETGPTATPPPLPTAAARPAPPPQKPGRNGGKAWWKLWLLLVIVLLIAAGGLAVAIWGGGDDDAGDDGKVVDETTSSTAEDVVRDEEDASAETAPAFTPAYTNALGMSFMLVKSGRFRPETTIGQPAGTVDEPLDPEDFSEAFYIMTTEVTQKQYAGIMGANPSRNQDCPECPVDNVSWRDAQEFIRRLNMKEGDNAYRLPTEAEWEYAARAGGGGPFPAGPLDEVGWYSGNAEGRTHPAAGKKANAWGLYDMQGNVREWTHSPVKNNRALKGGGYMSNENDCRAEARFAVGPEDKYSDLGLRLMMDAGRRARPGFDCGKPFCYQAVLQAENMYAGEVDGQAGQVTQSALAAYAAAYGLPAPGPVPEGEICQTLERSYSALAGRKATGLGMTKTVAEWSAFEGPGPLIPGGSRRVTTPPRPPRVTAPGQVLDQPRKEIEKITGPGS